MHWKWILIGAALLASAWCIPHFLQYRRRRIPLKGVALHRIRMVVRLHPTTPDIQVLHSHARLIMEQLLRIRRLLQRTPCLPEGSDDAPRLMSVAHDMTDRGDFSASAMLAAISETDPPASSREVAVLPLCVAASQCQRLDRVLATILSDAKERRQAARLIHRLHESKDPAALLNKAKLRPVMLAELLQQVHQPDTPELALIIHTWLQENNLNSEQLKAYVLERQLVLVEELHRAEACFSAVLRIDWLSRCAQADPMHALFEKDPSGLYPRLDAASQLALRCDAEDLARHAHRPTSDVLQSALNLATEADPSSPEHNLCYWFQDARGLRRLHRHLGTWKGTLYALFARRSDLMAYAFLWGFSMVLGFAFLQRHGPVFMLPFFLLVIGCISRRILQLFPRKRLPHLSIPGDNLRFRTLVVLHAVLDDPHTAIQTVRQLKTIMHALPKDVDFLLLGDFAPGVTSVLSSDQAIIHAAAAAVSALEDKRVMYLQRARAWNSLQHRYAAPGGTLGALTEICRLIAQDECNDIVAYSTVEAAWFERRYDYLLSLPASCQPLPGMYETLLGTMIHPFFVRMPRTDGWQGCSVLSPGDTPLFKSIGLIKPDTFLEAADGMLWPDREQFAVCGELGGHIAVPGARIQLQQPPQTWQTDYDNARQAWAAVLWQLPWVQTPAGMISNPLDLRGRFHLREWLRAALVPFGQLVLLIYALLIHSWPLLLLSLLAPSISKPFRDKKDIADMLCRLALLPASAVMPLRGGFDVLRKRTADQASLAALEVWAQGISATALAALGLAFPAFGLPALVLSVLFACFPLAHRYLETPILREKGLTSDQQHILAQIADTTWHYFQHHCFAKDALKVPAWIQNDPPFEQHLTSPEAIAASILACICSRELGMITSTGAACHLENLAHLLKELPMPYGLPCRSYDDSDLSISDQNVDARMCGVLLCALMTAAQALRSWLPELPEQYLSLSSELEEMISRIDLSQLFDSEAHLFHAGLDDEGQPQGHISFFADEGLLLSIAAFARGLIPPEHFSRLSRTRIRCSGGKLLLSESGTAAEHLLCGLFVPMDEQEAASFIHRMQRSGKDGVWGQGCSAFASFDPSLRYQKETFGIPEASANAVRQDPVFSPWSAALGLPFCPGDAAAVLARFMEMNTAGPCGFCDALDLSKEPLLVGLQDTFHQGVILMAVAHLLADAPVRRYFCAIPAVEACLPLLNADHSDILLPAQRTTHMIDQTSPATVHTVDVSQFPAEATILGNADFHVLADGAGQAQYFDHQLPLTRFDNRFASGIHFFLTADDQSFRLGTPSPESTVLFTPGEISMENHHGSLRAEIICTVDTLRRQMVHIISITNLSTRDQPLELTSVMIPDLESGSKTMEISQPDKDCLILHVRGTETTLYHRVNTVISPLSAEVCTDFSHFLNDEKLNCSLFSTSSHREYASVVPCPCLSFRIRMNLGGKGQTTLWFSTSLCEWDAPSFSDLASLRSRAALQHEAIEKMYPLTTEQGHALYQLLPHLWASRGCICVPTSDEQLLWHDLIPILTRLSNQGMSIRIYTDHWPEEIPAVIEQAPFSAAPLHSLQLSPDQPLLSQLTSRCTSRPFSAEAKAPRPAVLPHLPLEQESAYGGFDPDTTDFILRLRPHQHPPEPWENHHISHHFSETVDDNGFRSPFFEQLHIRMEDGTLLSPWSPALPRSMRIGLHETSWEAWSDSLDIRLIAAGLPGHSCGLRILRLRNESTHSQTLHLTVSGHLAEYPPLECEAGIITAAADKPGLQAFIARNEWTAQPVSATFSNDFSLCFIENPHGCCGLLECSITLEPHASKKAVWISGYASGNDDITDILSQLLSRGTTPFLRELRSEMTGKLSSLRITTPEDTLDLLMNRILPAQALSADHGYCSLAAMYLSPQQARDSILHEAMQCTTADNAGRLVHLISQYVDMTADDSLLDTHIPGSGETIYARFCRLLLSLPMDSQGLPEASNAVHCLLYASAAKLLNRLRPNAPLDEWAHRLLSAIDKELWKDGAYGHPLQLEAQALAMLAFGVTPRTRQAVQTCWRELYDRINGLIRSQHCLDTPLHPGLPGNGGMHTPEAALFLHAMLQSGYTEDAFELMRALNPLHHADSPERQEQFRCAPYLLHGGMMADPLEAGRGIPDGGAEAAAILYAVILQDLLGLCREGSRIHFEPCVPGQWDEYTISIQEGSSTWRITLDRHSSSLSIDGREQSGSDFVLVDDGRIHHVIVPLKQENRPVSS